MSTTPPKSIRFDAEELEAIRLQATRLRISESIVVRIAVRESLHLPVDAIVAVVTRNKGEL